MGSSKGGKSSKAPKQPQPKASGVVPYGSTGAASTHFKPEFTSWLPTDGRSAMLGDQPRQEFGNPTPLLQQQEAQEAAAAKAAAAGPAAGQSSAYQQYLQFSNNGMGGGGGSNPFSRITNLPSPGPDASAEDKAAQGKAMQRAILATFLGGRIKNA